MKTNLNDEYIELGRQACRAATSAGATQAEAWIQRESSITVSLENNQLRSSEAKDDPGYCIRAITNGAVGYARGMGLNPSTVIASAKNATAQSAAAEPDPTFKTLPPPNQYSAIENIYDPAITKLKPSDVIPWALECAQAALDTNPGVTLKADITVLTGTCAIVNSLGVAASETYTFADIELFAIINKNGDVGSYFDFTRSRALQNMRPLAQLAADTTSRAATFLGSTAAPTKEMPVILGPLAAWIFIRSLCEAADAEAIQRSRSFLAGKKGAQIASTALTVEEDPLYPSGMASSPFDAEGHPRKKTQLINNGRLSSYLHNSTTAARANEPLTGHADRHGYLSGVATGISNLSIIPGKSPESELISSVKNGIYILMGSLSPNPVNGAVSGTIDFGYIIENGKIAAPVSNAMVAGNIFDILNNIEAVSSDFRDEPGNTMPSILINNISVAGS